MNWEVHLRMKISTVPPISKSHSPNWKLSQWVPNSLHPHSNSLYVPSTPGTTCTDFSGMSSLWTIIRIIPSIRTPSPAIFAHQKSCRSCKAMPRGQHLHRPRWTGSLFLPPSLLALPWIRLIPIYPLLFEPKLNKDKIQSSIRTRYSPLD